MKHEIGWDGSFIIHDYHRTPPFASFLPGIAGRRGVPLWVFAVNRAQGVVSAGLANKDGAFMEYLPANKAYAAVGQTGFRTFLRFEDGSVREPFSERRHRVARTRMEITPHDLSFVEDDPKSGIEIRVRYFTVPDETFPGLCRRVTIRNRSRRRLRLDAIDGLPQLIPCGAPAALVKNMARTLEAFYDVVNMERGIPFYKLRTQPQDKAEVIRDPQGFFYWSRVEGTGSHRVGAIVHPSEVFGSDTGFTEPEVFQRGDRRPAPRFRGNQTPSAFTRAKLSIVPGASVEIASVIGHASDVAELNGAIRRRLEQPYFLDRAAEANRGVIAEVTDPFLTVSADERFDQYCRQSFLDNVMRGGMPALFESGNARPQSVYIFSRKHGDLERDYNAFLVEPSFLSQGNGNFRDVHQNRRSDVYFEPGIGDENVRFFYAMIHLDGHNPLELLPERFVLKKRDVFAASVRRVAGADGAKKIMTLLATEYRAGDLLRLLAGDPRASAARRDVKERLFAEILGASEKRYRANYGEGYWVDHWKYGLDLIEAYRGVYPDRFFELVFGREDYTFFRSPAEVLPRAEKQMLVDGEPRQLDAVRHDRAPAHAADSVALGSDGRPLTVNLFAKLLILLANKLASLDSSGTGIEMSADKPGWNDSLNGLPALFGSSTPELFEARNLARFMQAALEACEASPCRLPNEAAEFLADLSRLLGRNNSARTFWDRSHDAREKFLRRAAQGLSGRMTPVRLRAAAVLLARALAKLDAGLGRLTRGHGLPPTYFIHTPIAYARVKNSRNPHDARPRIRITKFRSRALPLFLEGVVHACRTFPARVPEFHRRIRASGLYDRKLGMYKLSESLAREDERIGRGATFRAGWLENETIWLHMEYKYLLELLRAGRHEEFFREWRKVGVPNLNPSVYGRSIFENSSFIVSSASDDSEAVGRGFVARLSGSTAEFVSMWVLMTMGARPFVVERGELRFRLRPALPGNFFTRSSRTAVWRGREVAVPSNAFAFAFLGRTLVVYRNRARRDTWKGVAPVRYRLELRDGKVVEAGGPELGEPLARIVRERGARRIDVELEG